MPHDPGPLPEQLLRRIAIEPERPVRAEQVQRVLQPLALRDGAGDRPDRHIRPRQLPRGPPHQLQRLVQRRSELRLPAAAAPAPRQEQQRRGRGRGRAMEVGAIGGLPRVHLGLRRYADACSCEVLPTAGAAGAGGGGGAAERLGLVMVGLGGGAGRDGGADRSNDVTKPYVISTYEN